MSRESGQEDQRAARAARLPTSYGRLFDTVRVRTAYRCRAYPDEQQQQVLNRTFGCVRVVWNRTLADRHARWQTDRKSTSYAQTDAALTILKKDPDLAFLNEVSASRCSRHSATSTRHSPHSSPDAPAARGSDPAAAGRPRTTPAEPSPCAAASCGWPSRPATLRFTWSWPDVDVTALDPTMVVCPGSRTAAGT